MNTKHNHTQTPLHFSITHAPLFMHLYTIAHTH